VGGLGLNSPRVQGMGVWNITSPQQNWYNNAQTPPPYREGVQHVNGVMGTEKTPQRTSTFSNPHTAQHPAPGNPGPRQNTSQDPPDQSNWLGAKT
jgi:hypothetical protein